MMSIEMEKVLRQMNQEGMKANKILEINPDHELFAALKKLNDEGKDITDYATLLYEQALLMAGLELEDPSAYALKISELMLKAIK